MGVIVYWLIVLAVLALGQLMPQHGRRRKAYIGAMAVLHAFVCGCRYMHLTGDLQKYHFEYLNVMSYGYFSEEVINEWKNTGFYWLMKFIADISNGNFQFFLIVLAVITEVIVAVLIFRYSPKPWLSYLVWNCMGFYVAGFSLIKQYLAMALVMCAMICIFERKPKSFLLFTIIAGFVHMPAFAFLPAYWISKLKIKMSTILGYIAAGGIIYLFRTPIVNLFSSLYYETDTFSLVTEGLGGRFFLIVLLLICGVFLKGFQDKRFEILFNIIIVAALFQMFSGFDNVFSRLTDYYLQFTVLYIPMIFYENPNLSVENRHYSAAFLPFNDRSLKILAAVVVVALIWFYYTTCIGVTISYAVDDYTNFRFMWNY